MAHSGRLHAGLWEVVFAGLILAWLMLTAARLTLGAWRMLPPPTGGGN